MATPLVIIDPAEAAVYAAAPQSRLGQLIEAKARVLDELDRLIRDEAQRSETEYTQRVSDLAARVVVRTKGPDGARIGPHPAKTFRGRQYNVTGPRSA